MTSEPAKTPLIALVFGASGVTGHGIIKALLSYPNATTFSRVIGLTNRPLSSSVARLPDDDRLELYSEINLLEREKSLLQLQHVPEIQQVTHVYYAAYAGHGSSFEELKRINNELLTNAIGGVEICCPALQFVTLNTGGKVRDLPYPTQLSLSNRHTLTAGPRPTASNSPPTSPSTHPSTSPPLASPSPTPTTSSTTPKPTSSPAPVPTSPGPTARSAPT